MKQWLWHGPPRFNGEDYRRAGGGRAGARVGGGFGGWWGRGPEPVQQRAPEGSLGAGTGDHADMSGGGLMQDGAGDQMGEGAGRGRRHDAVLAGHRDEAGRGN